MIMPFGCFKGLPVGCLPREYLEWLRENVDLRGRLKEAVFSTLDESTIEQPAARRRPFAVSLQVRPEDVPMIRDVFDRVYRDAAYTLRAKVGADPGAMVRLDALMESIRSQLRAVGEEQARRALTQAAVPQHRSMTGGHRDGELSGSTTH